MQPEAPVEVLDDGRAQAEGALGQSSPSAGCARAASPSPRSRGRTSGRSEGRSRSGRRRASAPAITRAPRRVEARLERALDAPRRGAWDAADAVRDVGDRRQTAARRPRRASRARCARSPGAKRRRPRASACRSRASAQTSPVGLGAADERAGCFELGRDSALAALEQDRDAPGVEDVERARLQLRAPERVDDAPPGRRSRRRASRWPRGADEAGAPRGRASPSLPAEPHMSFARSYPATFFTTFPPELATVPSPRTTVTPSTRSRGRAEAVGQRPREAPGDACADARVARRVERQSLTRRPSVVLEDGETHSGLDGAREISGLVLEDAVECPRREVLADPEPPALGARGGEERRGLLDRRRLQHQNRSASPARSSGMRAVRPGHLAAETRRRQHLARVREARRVERPPHPLEHLEVALGEHRRHRARLVDPDAVLAGQRAARVDAGAEDRVRERLRTLVLARRPRRRRARAGGGCRRRRGRRSRRAGRALRRAPRSSAAPRAASFSGRRRPGRSSRARRGPSRRTRPCARATGPRARPRCSRCGSRKRLRRGRSRRPPPCPPRPGPRRRRARPAAPRPRPPDSRGCTPPPPPGS